MELAGGIVGIVGLSIQLVALVDQAVTTFDRIQNAPQELQNFRSSAHKLLRHCQRLQVDLEGTSLDLENDELHEIEDTLQLCKNLLEKYEERQRSDGLVNGVLRAIWPVLNNERLARYRGRLDEHYRSILYPLWFRCINQRCRHIIECSDSEQTETLVDGTADPQTARVIQERIEEMNGLISRDDDSTEAVDIERDLREVDLGLDAIRQKLGLQADETNDEEADWTGAGLIDDRRRRSSLVFRIARTKLSLEGAAPQHQSLQLDRLHIMARDQKTRIIQYENLDSTIRVTHIIPYGSIPMTEHSNARRVKFVEHHTITVVDSNGYHLYHIKPRYRFDDSATCEEFQSTLRERRLCGAFDTVLIKEGSQQTSTRQVVKFWRRDMSQANQLITMTFLRNSVDDGDGTAHAEFDIAAFENEPRPYVHFLRSSTASDAVDMIPRQSKNNVSRIRIRFDSNDDAARFKQHFINLYSMSSRPPSERTSTIATANLQPNEHTTRFSTASSLPRSTISSDWSVSATPRTMTTPATSAMPTPLDTDWNRATAPTLPSSLDLGGASDDWVSYVNTFSTT